MFEDISNSIRNGINRAQQTTAGFIEASGEKIRQMVREYITESIPQEVKNVVDATQVDSEDLRNFTQDPSLENFTTLTNHIGNLFTRESEHESYSLIIRHLKGNTAEEKANNFRKLFKPKIREDGSVALVFAPTHGEISECFTENNRQIRSACFNLQTATRYAAVSTNNPTIIGSLVAIGYGTAECGSQLNAILRRAGENVSGQENQQTTRGNSNER